MRHLKLAFWILVAFLALLTAAIVILGNRAAAATNVTSTSPNFYAWNDTVGWLDFYTNDTVTVQGQQLKGYASSTVGPVSLDCASTPIGNVCGAVNYGVCNGPGPHAVDGSCPYGDGGYSTSNKLTGFAWNDTVGWISVNCDQTTHGGSNLCGTVNYAVSIDANGDFSGWAWNDTVGWISFNSISAGSPVTYKVASLWRSTSSVGYVESATIDTRTTPGGTLNSIIWNGSLPNNTCVDFQVATSTSASGPWNYRGPGGLSDAYFGASCAAGFTGGQGCAPANTPICIDPNLVANSRYLRYRVRLMTNQIQTETPQIDDIILNWSR
jgi:hypothetical protein